MTPLLDALVADLTAYLTANCVRPVSAKVRLLLADRGIDCAWTFAKSFGFADPYGAFRGEYLERFVWRAA